MNKFNIWSSERICIFLLIIAIVVPWCWTYGMWTLGDLQVPPGYSGDGVASYAFINAFSKFEIFPGLPKAVASLNAPFSANWNDFPFEDFIYFPAGILASFLGLSAAAWIYLLFIQLLAGLSFYFAARALRAEKVISCVCGALFALSPFAFYRGIPHLTVATCWHIPLLLISLLWCLDQKTVNITFRQGIVIGVGSGLMAGLYNPYYWVIFIFLLLIILCGALFGKDRRQLLWVTIILVSALVGFLALHMGTFMFWFAHGKGNAVNRDLFGLVVWGLRLPDLVAPVNNRLTYYSEIFNNYRSLYPGVLKGEAQGAYVGFIATVGLCMLVITGTGRVAAQQFERINSLYWVALGIFSFAVVGGINYMLGAFGFVYLRASNRYSIMFMALGLLVVTQIISRVKNRSFRALIAASILLIGYYDQLPVQESKGSKEFDLTRATADKLTAKLLDDNLLPNAMVFQLPIKDFPETGPINNMGDYDHFRPWIWTKNIRFSFGTMKGRGDADWQHELKNESLDHIVMDLNRYGFSALLINRTAYNDGADALRKQILNLGYEEIINLPEYYGFKLKPADHPALPRSSLYLKRFKKGFYGPEVDGKEYFQWADSDGVIEIEPSWWRSTNKDLARSKKINVTFDLRVISPRSVWIEFASNKSLVFAPSDTLRKVSFDIFVSDLPINIHLYSDRPGILLGNGDPRILAFQVRNFKIDERID